MQQRCCGKWRYARGAINARERTSLCWRRRGRARGGIAEQGASRPSCLCIPPGQHVERAPSEHAMSSEHRTESADAAFASAMRTSGRAALRRPTRRARRALGRKTTVAGRAADATALGPRAFVQVPWAKDLPKMAGREHQATAWSHRRPFAPARPRQRVRGDPRARQGVHVLLGGRKSHLVLGAGL